jgi:pyrimidine-nucleoside phosphorylase
MNPVALITAKRDGKALNTNAVKHLIDAYTRGEVPDYQMSAFLMAAFLQGMNDEETAALTDAMLYSGSVLDLSASPGIKVDKHSTGGVGDKVSLILAPIVVVPDATTPVTQTFRHRGAAATYADSSKCHDSSR